MALFAALLTLTSWRAPWNRVWMNPTGEYVLAIHHDPKAKVWRKRLFTLGADAADRTLWTSADEFYPSQVAVSDDGHVVTLNEYPGYAHRSAVAIYGDDGRVLKRYRVEDFIPKEEFDKLPGDEGLKPKIWIQTTWFESLRNLVSPPPVHLPPIDRKLNGTTIHNEFPVAFRLRTVTGETLTFDLVDGSFVRR